MMSVRTYTAAALPEDKVQGKEKQSMVERVWKVYGLSGHRQRESFSPSYEYNFSEGNDVRIIKVENADITGTNEYSIVHITRNTSEECLAEFEGQLSDGIFENSNVGYVEEIT